MELGSNGIQNKGSGGAGPTPPVINYLVATGGIETTDGDYKIHTFNASGDFEVLSLGDNPVIDFMLVAGGGSGGKSGAGGSAGGGGAGGLIYLQNQPITLGIKTVVVGNGGASKTSLGKGLDGQNSTFLGNTAIGGGAGGAGNAQPGNNGGSGGGGAYITANGLGTTDQGFAGGAYIGGNGGNGGGGAGSKGFSTIGNNGENGGVGRQTYINGTTSYFAGGGGGSIYFNNTGGIGGNGGGGNGSSIGIPPTSGTPNTGGGGGGGFNVDSGSGGSGVCIIRYKYQ